MFAFVLIIKKCEFIIINKLMLISLNNVNSFCIITLNFIINLSSARDSYINNISDIILILINKLTKHIMHIAIIKNLKTNKSVNII